MNGDILTPFHKEILRLFASLEESKAFYFSGAMALSAYYLHHRLSEDIDIFCPVENLIPVAAQKFAQRLSQENIEVDIIRSFGSFWEALLKRDAEEIRIQLAYDTPFHLADFSFYDGLNVHSLDDLATGKLLALFTRAEERDFIDVYLLVQEKGYTIKRLVELAKEKDPGVDEYYLALAFEKVEQLPDDIGQLRVTLLKPLDMRKLKTFFKQEAIFLLSSNLNK